LCCDTIIAPTLEHITTIRTRSINEQVPESRANIPPKFFASAAEAGPFKFKADSAYQEWITHAETNRLPKFLVKTLPKTLPPRRKTRPMSATLIGSSRLYQPDQVKLSRPYQQCRGRGMLRFARTRSASLNQAHGAIATKRPRSVKPAEMSARNPAYRVLEATVSFNYVSLYLAYSTGHAATAATTEVVPGAVIAIVRFCIHSLRAHCFTNTCV